MLPPQLIYEGKTTLCHAKFNFPNDWHITNSKSHWSNVDTMKEYLENILKPHIEKIRDEKDYPLKQKALLIIDVFKAHRVPEFIALCEKLLPCNFKKQAQSSLYGIVNSKLK